MIFLIENKKARMRFAILDTITAGIALTGGEAKAVRNKMGSIDGARVVVRGGEAFLIGMTIPPYQVANTKEDYEPEHPRKLLLKKKEIVELLDAEDTKGLTTVPLSLYNAGRYIKVSIGIVRGKGKADKREDIKKREAEKESARILKRRV